MVHLWFTQIKWPFFNKTERTVILVIFFILKDGHEWLIHENKKVVNLSMIQWYSYRKWMLIVEVNLTGPYLKKNQKNPQKKTEKTNKKTKQNKVKKLLDHIYI